MDERGKEFFVEGAILQTGSHSASQSAWIGWGGGSWQTKPAENELSFYAPDFYLTSPTPWFIPRHSANIGLDELMELLPVPASQPPLL